MTPRIHHFPTESFSHALSLDHSVNVRLDEMVHSTDFRAFPMSLDFGHCFAAPASQALSKFGPSTKLGIWSHVYTSLYPKLFPEQLFSIPTWVKSSLEVRDSRLLSLSLYLSFLIL